jgi:hypothetical protein
MLKIKNNLYQVISLAVDADIRVVIPGKQSKRVNLDEPTLEMNEMAKEGIIKIEVIN